ncbi:MAG TPA: FABP family protein [Microbacteriaceae bacterium]|nr:FABP family protein [Microbacteriaceae bacterium]
MITLDGSLPAEIAPLSWLLGVWEGSGVIDYRLGSADADGEHRTAEFGQRVSFSQDGGPYLSYASSTWLLPSGGSDDAPAPVRHLAETGYWRLARPLTDADAGPGLLPGTGERPFTTAEQVETLRNAAGGFDIEVAIVHPTGVSELYLGHVQGPRIDLASDAVVRSSTAKDYTAATRLYGLVDSHLLWAWDMAALGQSLRTHASARLERIE